MLFNLLTTLLALGTASNALVIPPRATTCNGRDELCSRSYGNVTFVGAHDSFAASKGINPARVQSIDVVDQLKMGVRMLQGQTHDKNGEIQLCHTNCLLFDGGSLVDYLKKVKTFMDENKNEVITMILTNPENISIKDKWKPAFDDAGMTDLAFVPKSLPVKQSEWPTLGEMIDTGKRLVVFMDSNAKPEEADFILPEFDMIWESPFGIEDTAGLKECKVDRIKGDLSVEDHLYMVNHNLNKQVLGGIFGLDITQADFGAADTTNSVQSIQDQVAACAPLGGNRQPNFVLLDFIEKGEAIKAQDLLNGF